MPSTSVKVNNNAIYVLIQQEGAKVLTVAALQTVNRAKELCPVDTGRLRSSITWKLVMSNGKIAAQVGTNVEYAPYVELGTRYMAARSFLRAALASLQGTSIG